MDNNQIALQLYTVREQTKQDMLGTLRALAGMGYRAFEFAGFAGVPTTEIRAVLDDLGLRAVADHVGLSRWDEDTAGVFRDLRTLGCTYAVLPWAGEEFRTHTGIGRLADRLNTLGAQCRDEGLVFAYHNHGFEFTPVDGTTMWDALTAATDPALVKLELDIYWARFAGADPLALVQQFAGRVPLLHIKDMAGDDSRRDMPVGDGVLPWDQLLPAARAAGAAWYIIEQDHPQDAMADVEHSLRNLEGLLGVKRET